MSPGEGERELLETLLRRVRRGTLVWRYEDGRVTRFGEGEPTTHVAWSARATHRTLTEGTLGFCDGYVDGDWRVEQGTLLDAMASLVSARLNQPIKARVPLGLRARLIAEGALARLRAERSVRSHYDLDTDFYRLWLDESLTYTCGYARRASDTLEQMQSQKLELVSDKLGLERGQRFLDLGCGWGSLALHAARRGLQVTAVNVSPPQLAWLRERAASEGLTSRIEVVLSDFRKVRGKFDRVAAIGLAEHVGQRKLADLFSTIADRLCTTGVGLVHTIGSTTTGGTDPWLERRIFPGSYVPSLAELVAATTRSDLRIAHVDNLGLHYGLTLRHWLRRFLAVRSQVAQERGERFARTWEMYLTMLIPTFEHLSTSVFQLLFTPGEAPAWAYPDPRTRANGHAAQRPLHVASEHLV